ncbi:hypothetical protein ACFLTH_13005 [Bacteroidota bacterium]
MNIALGIVVLVLSLICWIGQVISVIAPKLAVKLGLTENESNVDRVFFIEEKCEAIVDSLLTWIMIPASILLITDNPDWIYFGLIGGGIYIYFGIRITLIRIMLSKGGVKIGTPSNVKAAYVFGPLWALSGLTFIILSITSFGA